MEAPVADSEVTSDYEEADVDDGLEDVEFTPNEENELNNMIEQDGNEAEVAGTEAAVASIQYEENLNEEVQDEDLPEHYMITSDGAFVPLPRHNAPDVEVNFEDQLKSTEKLDRSSPDLWPQNLSTTAKQVLVKNRLKTGEADHSTNWAQGLDPEDINLLHQFGSLTSSSLVEEVKKLQNIAYTLGLDEKKELARGKLLHVLD